jgi:hypothetical protein
LNLRKTFENRQDRLLPAFKIGELALAGFQNQRVGSGCLSKSASWLWPAIKTGKKNGSGRLSKALGAATRNLLSNRSKGFELTGFKKLFAIQKVFALNFKEFINSI